MNALIDIDQLRTFIAIVETGSFTKAAEVVHKTQSAVSMQMKRLEERLSRPIFARDGRASKLTDDGERLLDYARRIVKLNVEALAAFNDAELTGRVRLGVPDDYAEHCKLMFDLQALAFQADLTRVASYIMVAEGTNRTYNHIGVSDAFHPVSHHANDIGRIEKLIKIQTWHVERFAAFVKKLAAIPDGEGTLLDHAMFLYGSNMSNSDKHNGYPLPTVLVGGGNGKLRGSQHLELPEPTPLANLHLTILDRINAKQDRFGDSTGLIAGI